MLTNRPPYIDLEFLADDPHDEACTACHEFDVVELKHDGMFGRAVIDRGELVIFSRTGRERHRHPYDGDLRAVLIGEYMVGTTRAKESNLHGRFVAFDCVEHDGEDMTAEPLCERRAVLESHDLPDGFDLVKQMPVSEWLRLWAANVATGEWEGLVFKHLDGEYGEPWGRMKRVETVEYVCMGVNAGSGQFAGQVASIQGGLYRDGKLVRVCNVAGLTHAQRAALVAAPRIGQVFEATGNGRFASGALRHPTFICWRPDKRAAECAA